MREREGGGEKGREKEIERERESYNVQRTLNIIAHKKYFEMYLKTDTGIKKQRILIL